MTYTKYHMNLRNSQCNCWNIMPEIGAKVGHFMV